MNFVREKKMATTIRHLRPVAGGGGFEMRQSLAAAAAAARSVARIPTTAALLRCATTTSPRAQRAWRRPSNVRFATSYAHKSPEPPAVDRSKSKLYASADEAVADIKSGSVILSSGFGLCGVAGEFFSPSHSLDLFGAQANAP